jgi:hypothetical protein
MGRKPEGYKVSGKSDSGVSRKKTYSNLVVPLGISVLDPLKIVPVGTFLFGQERLAYIASQQQSSKIDESLAGKNTSDLVLTQLIESKYEIEREEQMLLSEMTGDSGA